MGKDVAEALGYSNTPDALSRHVNTENKTHAPIQGECSTGTQDAIIITKSGLSKILMLSQNPKARQFKIKIK